VVLWHEGASRSRQPHQAHSHGGNRGQCRRQPGAAPTVARRETRGWGDQATQLCRYLPHGGPAPIPACPKASDPGRPAANHELCIVSFPCRATMQAYQSKTRQRDNSQVSSRSPRLRGLAEAMPKRQKFGERSGAGAWSTVSGASAGAVLKIPSWTNRSRTPSSRLSV
jgi:hypothetical protein